jgi:hypothetical protein
MRRNSYYLRLTDGGFENHGEEGNSNLSHGGRSQVTQVLPLYQKSFTVDQKFKSNSVFGIFLAESGNLNSRSPLDLDLLTLEMRLTVATEPSTKTQGKQVHLGSDLPGTECQGPLGSQWCVSVCLHTCGLMCAWVCLNVCAYAHAYVCTLHVCTQACALVHVSACICVCVRVQRQQTGGNLGTSALQVKAKQLRCTEQRC